MTKTIGLTGRLVATTVAVVVCCLIWTLITFRLDSNTREAVKDAAAVLGLAGIGLAALTYTGEERERRSNRKLERGKLIMQIMSEFYGSEDHEEIRRALREHEALPRPPNQPNSLRWDEIWLMNFFESLAITLQEELLTPDILNKMLGTPIMEVQYNPVLKELVSSAGSHHSYEGYTEVLFPAISKERSHQSTFRK